MMANPSHPPSHAVGLIGIEGQRRQRIEKLVDPGAGAQLVVDGRAQWPANGLLIGLTSSRLGHDPQTHQAACRFLSRSVLDARSRGAVLVVAAGSAIEPWAVRASELFRVPIVRICVDRRCRASRRALGRCDAPVHFVANQDATIHRDELLISLADRVDAVWVRRGGTIERTLARRLEHFSDASVRVVVSDRTGCAGNGLVARGAIGWYRPQSSARDHPAVSIGQPAIDDRGRESSAFTGDWLVHCTRGRRGCWPDETMAQFRDAMILGADDVAKRTPLDALVRILRSGRLVGSAVTSATKYPVVCFSHVPLASLLSRRCFRSHVGRWDYEPYGIAIESAAAKRVGIKPVIYGRPEQRSTIDSADQFRFHPTGETFDWQAEREWRWPGTLSLSQFAPHELRVFCLDDARARDRLAHFPYSVDWIDPA